jgi:DNA-binding transcriptional MerR regulator
LAAEPQADRGGSHAATADARTGGAEPRAGGMLKMSELAERSGVSAGTIKHYLREGLLGGDDEIKRTSRNMAWYPPEFVERIRAIKRLQEQHFLPLRVIRDLMRDDPQRVEALLALEARILERAAVAVGERTRTSRKTVEEAYDVPRNVLERLEQIEVLTPNGRGYDADDVKIIEAISRFRAGGYDEAIGFTVYDTLRYREALAPLVEEEVRVLLGRLAGSVDEDRAVEIIASGAEPLQELIGAVHSKLLLAALRRERERRRG